jgi:hypothetical protein
MSDLAEFITRLRQTLGDPAGERYGESLLAEALRKALAGYDQAAPLVRIQDVIFAGDGRQQALAGLGGLLSLQQVVYPYVDENSPATHAYTWYWLDGVAVLDLSTRAAPRAGETARLTFSARNTIAGLDGAAETSLPAEHDTALVEGAAAFAQMMRALSINEAYNNRNTQLDLLEESRRRLESYEEMLRRIGRLAFTPPGAFAAGGWRLDRWDGIRS